MKVRYYVLCAASGCVWAAIAYAIGHRPMPRDIVWGGIALSPLIGVAVGAMYRPAYRVFGLMRVVMPLLALYAAAALFGLAAGMFDAAQGLPGGAPRDTVEVIYTGIAGTLYGLTFTGYVVVLWPLAHLNHWFVGLLADPLNKRKQQSHSSGR